MIGYYTNIRISKKESKILYEDPDDYIWYSTIVKALFNDHRFFQVREDIKLPEKEGENGVVLFFEKGSLVYLKTLNRDIDNKEYKDIWDVCTYLYNTFNQPVTAYIAYSPYCDVNITENYEGDELIKVIFSYFGEFNGEDIIERLSYKLKHKQEFNTSDSISHMLLPFTASKDMDVFKEKYADYMNMIENYEVEE